MIQLRYMLSSSRPGLENNPALQVLRARTQFQHQQSLARLRPMACTVTAPSTAHCRRSPRPPHTGHLRPLGHVGEYWPVSGSVAGAPPGLPPGPPPPLPCPSSPALSALTPTLGALPLQDFADMGVRDIRDICVAGRGSPG